MKKLMLFIIISLVTCPLKAQESFGEFISSFPKYSSWEALPEDIRDIKIPDKELEANKVNIYIYSDPYRGDEKPVNKNDTRKPPLRMAWDGTYFKGDEGKYSNKAEINVDNTVVIIYYQIYPLARVHINDSICMVFLLYDGPGAGDNFLGKNVYYEAYTFNTVREKVLSSITLFKDAKMFFSYIREERHIYMRNMNTLPMIMEVRI
ncbi:MAG: hypothetical protein LBR26_07570 [Prevotella sp.]|jgi:hypothetical protein|nr:hypothetical protein [Prevotella sp.]